MKQGKANFAGTLGIAAIVAIGFLTVYFLYINPMTAEAPPELPTGGIIVPSDGTAVSCPDTFQTTGYARVQDTGASTLSYLGGKRIYFQDTTTKAYSVMTSNTAGYSATVTLDCGKAYDIITTTNGSVSGSAQALNQVASRSEIRIPMNTNAMSGIEVRIKDITTEVYAGMNNSEGGTSIVNSYLRPNSTQVWANTTANDIAVGTDGDLQYKIFARAATANTKVADDGAGGIIWMCVDVGSDVEWDKPSVAFDGTEITENKVGIDSTSTTYSLVSAADYCYQLGNVGRTPHEIDFYIKARSGQNPDTTNDDLVISLLPVGIYQSFVSPDTFKTGIANDGSTQSLVGVRSIDTPTITYRIE